jgi:CubicO group peptidase (beta-lactamase class C family)
MNGSVQKVFDATAVLQLFESGAIDLNADVGTYVPFAVRHPDYPDVPVTITMLLSHRSGLNAFADQFSWDTECLFTPEYRPTCRFELADMSLGEFLVESLTAAGSNYHAGAWVCEPGQEYHYSISTYLLLRYLVEQVSGQTYPDYMQENVFAPLNMSDSGFSSTRFIGHHAIPHTRIDGENVELPVWNGNGYMMRSTAKDMAKFMIAHMNDGRYGDYQLLQPQTIELMRKKTTRGGSSPNRGSNLHDEGHGLGILHYAHGWLGYGGSTPGFQCLWRFEPSKQVGYVILVNVNAILGGGENYDSARRDIYSVQDALVSVIDPAPVSGFSPREMLILGAFLLAMAVINIIYWHRKARARSGRS